MDTNPKQFEKNNSKNESLIVSKRQEIGKDDDDPLSIRETSLTFLGIILAFMTVFVPSLSVLLDRPLLQENGVHNNQIIK